MINGVLLILLAVLLMSPSTARSPDIQHIQNGDTIFIYEQNLDLTDLRIGVHPVTSLRKYTDDNPSKALIWEVPVQDDKSFSLSPALFGGLTGVFYAYNPTDHAMGSVIVALPSVSIDVVLASPNHADVVSGFSISPKTEITFRITSTDVGSSYHAGSLYPATVDLVLTNPGGGQLTLFQGRDFSRINLSSAVIYTDDAGEPGAITFEGLEAGSYSVQAKWRDPASFDQQAPDSNIYYFTVGNRISAPPATQPTTPVMTTPAVVTTPAPITQTTSPATVPSSVTTSPPPTMPPSTPTPAGSTAPSPTPTPSGVLTAVLSPALAVLLLLRGRKAR